MTCVVSCLFKVTITVERRGVPPLLVRVVVDGPEGRQLAARAPRVRRVVRFRREQVAVLVLHPCAQSIVLSRKRAHMRPLGGVAHGGSEVAVDGGLSGRGHAARCFGNRAAKPALGPRTRRPSTLSWRTTSRTAGRHGDPCQRIRKQAYEHLILRGRFFLRNAQLGPSS